MEKLKLDTGSLPIVPHKALALEISIFFALLLNALTFALSKLYVGIDSRVTFAVAALSAVLGIILAACLSENFNLNFIVIYTPLVLWFGSLIKRGMTKSFVGRGRPTTRITEVNSALRRPDMITWVSETAVVYLICMPIWCIVTTNHLKSNIPFIKREIIAFAVIYAISFIANFSEKKKSVPRKHATDYTILKSRNLWKTLSAPCLIVQWIMIQIFYAILVYRLNSNQSHLTQLFLVSIFLISALFLLLPKTKLHLKLPLNSISAKVLPSIQTSVKTGPRKSSVIKPLKPRPASKPLPKTKPKISSSKQSLSTPAEKKKSVIKKKDQPAITSFGPADSVKRTPRRRSVVTSYS